MALNAAVVTALSGAPTRQSDDRSTSKLHSMSAAGQAPGDAALGAAGRPSMQGYNQSAEFFLSNYRLGRTLGIGSFGKVMVPEHHLMLPLLRPG